MTTHVEDAALPFEHEDRSQSVLVVLILGLVLFMALAGTFAMKYNAQRSAIEQACEQVEAAAKLDISSFVPLCK